MLSNIREYTREIVTFGGFVLAIFVYLDFRQMVEDTTRTQAQTTEILRNIDARLSELERGARHSN